MWHSVVVVVLVGLLCLTRYETRASFLVSAARVLNSRIFMDAPQKAAQDGYYMETHHIVTEDGYILGVHRLNGGNTTAPPVIFYHGQTSYSDCWIMFGKNRSLAYQLVDSGYDVWLANARGNLYSRNHTTLDPSSQTFWKFNWHEMGVYDLAAIIDYCLNTTGQNQVFYVGHSMGGTVIHALLSSRPEYNSKIRLNIGLAPGVFYGHIRNYQTRFVAFFWRIGKVLLDVTEMQELLPYNQDLIALLYFVCNDRSLLQPICINIITQSFGDSSGINKANLPLLTSLVFGGFSANTLWHFAQLVRSGKFQYYDYGWLGSMQRYGSRSPPEYNLSLVTAPEAIHYGDTDTYVTDTDSRILAATVPNVVELREVPVKGFNHLDFLFHDMVKDLLYDHVVETIQQNS